MELEIFAAAIQEIVDITVSMFKNDDLNMAGRVEPLEEIIDDLEKDEEADTDET